MNALQVGLIFATVTTAAALVYGAAAGLARVGRRAFWVAMVVGLAVWVVLAWTRPPSLALGSAAALGAGTLAGVGMGRVFGDRERVLAFTVAAAIADIISVYWGAAGDLARSARGAGSVLSYLAVSVPLEGAVIYVVGAGDLLFLAYFFTAFRSLDVAPVPRFTVPVAGLLAALAFGLATPGPAPGIPFMAAAVVPYVLLWVKPSPGHRRVFPR